MTTDTETTNKRTVTQIDLRKPFILALDQTATRNTVRLFGEDEADEAHAYAESRAAETGRDVALMTPLMVIGRTVSAIPLGHLPGAQSEDMTFDNRAETPDAE